MNIKSVNFVFAILIFLASLASGESVRIALISNTFEARTIADLVTARISSDAGVELLERDDMGALYSEIGTALQSGGLGDLSERIQLLDVELFAVFSADEDYSSSSLIVFDSKTGIRLADAALDARDIAAQTDDAYARLRLAVEKRRQLDEGALKTVSIVALRNAGLARTEASDVRATGYLFEQMLVNAEDIILLERRSLELVNRERWLAPRDEALQMEAGGTLIEMEVGRGSDSRLRVLALANDNAGNQLARMEVEADEPTELAAALFAELSKVLDSSAVSTVPDVNREAARLFAEYRYLRLYAIADGGAPSVEPLELMEAAAALDPSLEYPYLAEALILALYSKDREEYFDRLERGLDIRRRVQQKNPTMLGFDSWVGIATGTERRLAQLCEERFISRFSSELQERRKAVLLRYVLLNAEVATARADKILDDHGGVQLHELDYRAMSEYVEGFDSVVFRGVHSSEWYPEVRRLFLEWMLHRPEDFERWFEAMAWLMRRFEDQQEFQGFRTRWKLAWLGIFLREIARDGLQPDDPPVLETATRLFDLYRDLELNRTTFLLHPSRRAGFEFKPLQNISPAFQPSHDLSVPPLDSSLEAGRRRAISSGLEWLASRQIEDGTWIEKLNEINTGVSTGLAVLAFLSSGEGVPGGLYGEHVERGLRYLVEDALMSSGHFYSSMSASTFICKDAIPAYALSEAYALTGYPVLKQAAKKALEAIIQSQQPYIRDVHTSQPTQPRLFHIYAQSIRPLVLAYELGFEIEGLDNALSLAAGAILNNFDDSSGLFRFFIMPPHLNNAWSGRNPANLQSSIAPTLALQWLGLRDEAEAQAAWNAIRAHGLEPYPASLPSSMSNYWLTQLMLWADVEEWSARSEHHYTSLIESQLEDGSWRGSLMATAYNVLSLTTIDQNLLMHSVSSGESTHSPVTVAVDEELSWKSVTPLIEGKRLIFAVQDGGNIYVGHNPAGSSRRWGPMHISRIRLSDFSESRLTVNHFSHAPPRGVVFYDHFETTQVRTAFSPESIFFGDTKGFWIIPREGGEPRLVTRDDGLPLGSVTALAWFDGAVYLAIGGKDFVRFDLGDRTAEVLFSHGRLDSDHPLNKIDLSPNIRAIKADAERERIILLIGARGGRYDSEISRIGGLWEYRVDCGSWRQLFSTVDSSMGVSRQGDKLLVVGSRVGLIYDLESDDPKIFYYHGTEDPEPAAWPGDPFPRLLRRDRIVLPPYYFDGKWLWGAGPAAKTDLNTGEVVRIQSVTLEEGAAAGVVVGKSTDGSTIVVATWNGLWALEMESDGTQKKGN